VLELLIDEPIFIGFKASRALRHLLESLSNVEKAYISSDDSAFLRACEIGEDLYVGKVVREALSTDHVEDVRRNILSILRKLGPVVPLPTTLRIFSCRAGGTAVAATATAVDALSSPPPDSSRSLVGAIR
jgi:hypothetical protein